MTNLELMDFPVNDPRWAENRLIAARIKGILDPISWVDSRGKFPTFTAIDNPAIRLEASSLNVRRDTFRGRVLEFAPGLPEWFELPIYGLRVSRRDNLPDLSTYAGHVFESYLFGSERRLYAVNNWLNFNLAGQAVKSESLYEIELAKQNPYGYLESIEKDLESVPQLDSVQGAGLRWTNLDPGDYEKALYLISQVESGRFVERVL